MTSVAWSTIIITWHFKVLSEQVPEIFRMMSPLGRLCDLLNSVPKIEK